jgi:Cro/C1-type HTH DNA-binding domain
MHHDHTRATLWRNLSALMSHHWGRENLTRLSRDAGIGPGTASRIKACETSIGLDVLSDIAKVFHLQPWQLLVDGLDPADPPAAPPLTMSDAARVQSIAEAAGGITRKGY